VARPDAVVAQPVPDDGEPAVSVTDLGTIDHPASAAVDINNRGKVVGNAFDPATPGQSTPVAWWQGDGRLLGYGEHENGRTLQLNDQNLLTGTLDGGPGVTHAVFWDHHGRRNVLRPNANFSAAVDLNDNGDVLLWYALDDGSANGTTDYASVWSEGRETHVLPATAGAGRIDPGLRLRPVALNDRGDVAITIEGPDGEPVRAYHWYDGYLRDLGSLGGGGTQAAAIDRYGRIAGTSRDGDGRERAFVWQQGEMYDLGTLGGETARVLPERTSMSDAGHVVGLSEDAEGRERAFLWEEGDMSDLGTLGGGEPEPTAVNDEGEVTGRDVTDEGELHAFFWDGEEMLDLGTLGGDMSRSYALNDRGQVVGVSLTDTGAHHATLWEIADT
jgi:probable HAF family extracellular repeat protein